MAGAGRILRTADGGAHWALQLATDSNFGEVDFVSATTGWALGSHELLRTTDAGVCWLSMDEPAAGALRQVHFVTPTLGFGVAGGTFALDPSRQAASSVEDEGFGGPFAPVDPRSGGVLVVTADGGRRWRRVPSAPPNAQSVCFVSASDGWLGAGGGLYRSVDGGRHWREVADPGASSGAAPRGTDVADVGCGAPSQVWLASDTGSAALGSSPWAVFASTTGDGAQLLQADMYSGADAPGPPGTPGSYPGPISVIGDGLAAVAGYTPAEAPPGTTKVEVIDASGKELHPPRPVPGIAMPNGLAFLSATDGWVVGDGSRRNRELETSLGLIEHTANGGRTWTVQDRVR